MSKDKISDYSATANSNTDIGGINIDEGCAPSGINDAIRTLMKQLKDWQSGSQDVYIHPAGSASAPSITATGDTNTGIFFPAADTVGITTGGTERARVDSSGNLGLGVTPSAWSAAYKATQLGTVSAIWGSTGGDHDTNVGSNIYFNGTNNLYIASDYATQYQQYQGKHIWFTAPSGTAGNAITFTQAMTLDASGNLGIGTTSPAYRLDVRDTNATVFSRGTAGYGAFYAQGSGTNSSYIFMGNATSGEQGRITCADTGILTFSNGSGATERARIDSSGNLLVGKTSASNATNGAQLSSTYQIFTNTSDYVSIFNRRGTDGVSVYFQKAETNVGNISVTSSATAYNTSSDYRLKDNIAPMTGALAKIALLNPVTFKWKIDGSDGQGFIAHELAEVEAGCVTGEKDAVDEEGNPVYQGIDTSFLVATLTAALQEAHGLIKDLQTRVAALES